jgi:hypothetical protein
MNNDAILVTFQKSNIYDNSSFIHEIHMCDHVKFIFETFSPIIIVLFRD